MTLAYILLLAVVGLERLLELDFDALVSAHGAPLMQGAKVAARAAVTDAYAA